MAVLGTPLLSALPTQKQDGKPGEGWIRSPYGQKVLRILSAGESRWAKWVEVTDADITPSLASPSEAGYNQLVWR